MAKASQNVVSSDPLDYTRAVFYLRRGISACEEIRSLVGNENDILLEDVDKLGDTKPDWVRGIPTAVQINPIKVMTGTAAIEYAKSLVASTFPQAHADAFEAHRGSTLTDKSQNETFADLFRLSDEAAEIQDEPVKDKPIKKQVTSLEDMMRMREQRG